MKTSLESFLRGGISHTTVLILLLLPMLLLGMAAETTKAEVVDLSLLVAAELPCTWPHPRFAHFQINHYRRVGLASPYNIDILTIDGNTGTQLDVPPHSVARPELGLPNSGSFRSYVHRQGPCLAVWW